MKQFPDCSLSILQYIYMYSDHGNRVVVHFILMHDVIFEWSDFHSDLLLSQNTCVIVRTDFFPGRSTFLTYLSHPKDSGYSLLLSSTSDGWIKLSVAMMPQKFSQDVYFLKDCQLSYRYILFIYIFIIHYDYFIQFYQRSLISPLFMINILHNTKMRKYTLKLTIIMLTTEKFVQIF